MAKQADMYFRLDPWNIIEEGFNPKKNLVSESIFSLGNEYMGIRGYFDEGYSGKTLLGSYFNGVYETAREMTKNSYKGIVKRTHFLINSVNWLHTKINLDGEILDFQTSRIENFSRILNMKTGTLKREFIWITPSDKRIRLSFLRFLDMEISCRGYQKIEMEALNFSGSIEIETGLDFNIIHQTREECRWSEIKKESREKGSAIIAVTESTNQRIFSGYQYKTTGTTISKKLERERFTGHNIILELKKGKTSVFEKLVCNIVEKDSNVALKTLWEHGQKEMDSQGDTGFQKAVLRQEKYWERIWEKLDIIINGDEKNQQGIRFCIFQLQQTYHGQNPTNNIGAKGLTGEAYNGHAFWDTETYCLPFYLFSNLPAAKNLLEYRYSTLPNALSRAGELDCRGACYPVATLNGDEACDLWQHASLQFQPSTGVAYGIMHYAHISGDDEFLWGHGAEMLVQISRFLVSRGDWSQTKKQFGYYGVMGPDEFHMMVNNNGYTNFMAKKTFEYTMKIIRKMQSDVPEKYKDLIQKTGLKEDELDEFRLCGENMILLHDPDTGLFEQHEGFFNLPHIDVDDIPQTDFPLYHNWSYDRIYRTDMIKQPDVLMFMFLYSQDFSLESKRVNYDFYEPRTIHESSLSPSIHSVFASELNRHQTAFDFFGFATRMDLDNYNRNTGEGLHITSINAAWINIVYGFGGMRSDSDHLLFNPSIPAPWESYSFKIQYKNEILSFHVNHKELTVKTLNSGKAEIFIYGEKQTINPEGITLSIPDCRRG